MIRPIPAVLSFALLSVLTACSGGDARYSGGPEPRQEPYRSGVIHMGHWGIGPFRADTYFESPVIQDLFPDAKVKDVKIKLAEDDSEDGITVVQDGVELFEVDDSTIDTGPDQDPPIGQVRAIAGPVIGPNGETLGMSWTAAKFDLSQCEIGVERDRNTVICARRGEGAITYYFAVPTWDSEELPPESLLRKVGYLKAFVWTPPPAAAPSGALSSAPRTS
jgi:hypothetical protein